jgi:hypothetical protein
MTIAWAGAMLALVVIVDVNVAFNVALAMIGIPLALMLPRLIRPAE